MNLYECEAKKLLEKNGIEVPSGFEYHRYGADDFLASVQFPVVAKAQVLAGRRQKEGGIVFIHQHEALRPSLEELFSRRIAGMGIDFVRIEEKLNPEKEFYISFTYDTQYSSPVATFSPCGGIDIEETATTHPDLIYKIPFDARVGLQAVDIYPMLVRAKIVDEEREALARLIETLGAVFFKEDLRLLEINPLAKINHNRFVAIDAKIALDDDAWFRHDEWRGYSPRTVMGRMPTERERAAKKIDEGEFYYRGTASKFLEFDGDIAILFSGGGASMACMDALVRAGGKPANYTEYSGNPPREKVAQLANIVLSDPDINGLWIVGGFANFTRIDETFAGIVDVFEEMRPKYPIVIRRAGPYDNRGKELMEQARDRLGLDLTYFGREDSMTHSAGLIVQKAGAYKERKNVQKNI